MTTKQITLEVLAERVDNLAKQVTLLTGIILASAGAILLATLGLIFTNLQKDNNPVHISSKISYEEYHH